jgi:hypothetical protein
MTAKRAKRRDWARSYPPLLSVVVAGLIAAFVLPSALNLPQTNPSQTLEYAPVPPTDKDQPPPVGNMASLGLGSSDSTAADTIGGSDGSLAPPPPPPPVDAGVGGHPSQYRCVGNPPKQTDDPLAPPCVAYFEGDNFGATYQGVTKNEVRVLVYHECCIYNITSRGTEPDPADKYYDLADPPKDDDPVEVRNLRAFQKYFNTRYQTYKRFVHFFVRFGPDTGTDPVTPEQRRADAAQDYAKVKPFAVLTYTTNGNEQAYLDAMADKGVLNFGAAHGRPLSFFRKYPKLNWGFWPALEIQAKQFSSFVCTKVVNRKVTFSGNAGDMGKPRKLGLLYAVNPDKPEFTAFAKLVRSQVEACGGHFDRAQTYTATGSAASNTEQQTAATNMAAFQQAGITTIIWPQGFETLHSQAGGRASYRPEWVVAGDGGLEGYGADTFQDQESWSHAWVVTPLLLTPPASKSRCAQAMREGDPNAASQDITQSCTLRDFYVELRQLFTGIQVAGPKLTPSSIDEGFHAIPPHPTSDPEVPACYYDTGDYTCVKDAVAMWWDPNSTAPGATQKGCWRMPKGGRRYLIDQWPSGDVLAQKGPNDPCNSYSGVYFV